LLNEEERFPPLPPRDYVGRRPLQALVNRPMFRPQVQMAWQSENTPPNRESPSRQSPDRQNQRRQPNFYRQRLSHTPVEVQIRHFREEIEELLQSVRNSSRSTNQAFQRRNRRTSTISKKYAKSSQKP